MSLSKYYVYRFLDEAGNIIYIGKTNNINKRMESQHFSQQGHLPRECYLETCRIEYAQLKTDNTMRIYEIYLISKYKPAYNQEFNYKDEAIGIELPEPAWKEYNITSNMRASIKSMKQDEAYWEAKEQYDMESWQMCFAALGGGL